MIKLILNTLLISCVIFSPIIMASQPTTDYLFQSTGKYSVAFKDLHWINNTVCPDPNFSTKNQGIFDSHNKKYCHELSVRIYYPTQFKAGDGTPYYQSIIRAEKKVLQTIPTVKLNDIKTLQQLKSHTIENAPVVQHRQFPVILFISGSGGLAQMYENIITQLVSHGYIVVGINSMFIHGDIILPNKQVVSMADVGNWEVVSNITMPGLEKDIAFVYRKIKKKTQDDVFQSMDLKHIGAVGHSFGGRAIAEVANQHEKWFQAIATLDMEVHMGSFEPKSLMLPFMHIISAYWRTAFDWQNLRYPLNKKGYLVTLSPLKNNIHYSYHMNFTDLSTLQYMPAYEASKAYEHSKLSIKEEVIIRGDGENLNLTTINKPLYYITKKKNMWQVFYYEPGKKSTIINLENIPSLQIALNNLPQTQIKESDRILIKKIIHAYHLRYGNFLGYGNGWKITEALNLYLLDFFNTFLKHKKNAFTGCVPLTKNTYLECGPGIF